jgi:chaperonin GroEL
MNKLIEFDEKAREKLLIGVKKVADSVGATLGPLGHNVAIGNLWGAYPQVVHDGVTVAKSITLKDPFENIGAQIVKESSIKTNDLAGDGTTTATILAYAITAEGMIHLLNGVNAMKIRHEIAEASKAVFDYLKSQTKPVTTLKEKETIATISAQDSEIGHVVSEALEKVGVDGVVSVEDGTGKDISIEYKEGMQFDKGYVSPYFITDMAKEISVINDPYILVTDHTISSAKDILPLLESLLQQSRDLVVICDRLEGEALATLIANKLRGTLNILVVSSPGFGAQRRALLEDIAELVGAKFIDKDTKKLTQVMVEDLGKAQKVTSTSETTSIIGGQGNIKERVKSLKEKLKSTTAVYDKEKLQERISKLTSGVAIIHVGASTEVEMKEKKERATDAVAATRAAVEEGIVPGGATVFLRASELLDGKSTGSKILKSALTKPFRVLMENSGIDYLESVSKVKSAKEGEGIDVTDGELKNMIDSGIIDPAKVVRLALESAISVAGSIITTNVLIVDEPKEEKDEKSQTVLG